MDLKDTPEVDATPALQSIKDAMAKEDLAPQHHDRAVWETQREAYGPKGSTPYIYTSYHFN